MIKLKVSGKVWCMPIDMHDLKGKLNRLNSDRWFYSDLVCTKQHVILDR